MLLKRKTGPLLRASTSALLTRKACVVLRASTRALFRTHATKTTMCGGQPSAMSKAHALALVEAHALRPNRSHVVHRGNLILSSREPTSILGIL